MSRKPLGEAAMTNADRSRRGREKAKACAMPRHSRPIGRVPLLSPPRLTSTRPMLSPHC
jgi:hypothetical protein